jgi:hypothetical protein
MRQDLQTVEVFDSASLQTVNGVPTVVGLGKIDARNPLAVGVSVALANSGSAPVYAYGVASNDAVGHANARDSMSMRSDLYAFVPLTQNINIHASYKTEFDDLADPTTALENGVPQKFRVVIGSIPLPTTTTVYEGGITGVAQQSGIASGLYRTIDIDSGSTGSNLAVNFVLPGDTVIIGLVDPADVAWQNRRGSHTVGHVNASFSVGVTNSTFEIIPGSSRWDSTAAPAGNSDIEIVIKGPDGSVKMSNLAQATISTGAGPTLSTIQYDMKNPTVVGGPYTVEYVVVGAAPAVSVAVVGFAITVTVNGTSHTADNVAAAINANSITSALMTALVTAGGSNAVLVSAPTSVEPVAGSCDTVITISDNLFNRLEDASALFLTAGVRAGDTIEMPLDPNNYGPDAYATRFLTYTVATVLSENRILVQCPTDDTGSVANELPHYYLRDVANRVLDNTLPNAINYRIRRQLTKDEQILNLVTTAQSVRSKRCTLTWPDTVQVSDLRNGALPRATASIRTLAGDVEGYYVSCQVGGACAGLPAQHGLTNLGLSGVNVLRHSQGYFTERQLSRLSDGGFFVMVQNVLAPCRSASTS